MKKYWLLILISNASFGSTLNVGLVGQYNFDKGTAEDTSGNNNNGTAFNVITSIGVQGGAFKFNGINSIIKINTLIPHYTTSGTIFSWYRANPNPDLSVQSPYGGIAAAYQTILGQNRKQNDYAPGLFLTIWNPEYLQTGYFSSANFKIRSGYSDEFPGNLSWHNIELESQSPESMGLDGVWHSIGTSISSNENGKTLKLYFDGNLVSSSNFGNPDIEAFTNGEFFIGGSADVTDPRSSFNGDIDNVYVYNRTLTEQEIFDLHTSTPEPSALSLLAVGLGGLAILRHRRL